MFQEELLTKFNVLPLNDKSLIGFEDSYLQIVNSSEILNCSTKSVREKMLEKIKIKTE